MRLTSFLIISTFTLLFCTTSLAEEEAATPEMSAAEKKIRSANPDLPIDHIIPFPQMPGLYEIKVGRDLFYIDETGQYIFSGHIFETGTKRDLTAERIDELSRIDWDLLPLKKAIVTGDPDGVPVAVFTDPDCPYCAKLEGQFAKTKGLKIYQFLYPLESLHPYAKGKAEAIWCASNQQQALHDVLVNRKPITGGDCENPIEDIIHLGKALGIQGTPTLIARDGRRRASTMDAAELEKWAKAGQ